MIKLGIVGTNFVSSWLADAARELGVSLFAVYSRSEKTGNAFKEAESVGAVYTDLDAFLHSGIEAVYIASPTYCHFTMAKAALSAGLHVLLEKPMVAHKREFDELHALAEEKGLVLLEAMRPLHDPAFLLVKEAMGEIGKVRRASFEFCQYSSRYDAYRSGTVFNAFDPKVSGAALLDIGIYPLSWAVALFGAPDTVLGRATFLENGFEGGGVILLGYGDCQVSVTYSKLCSSVTESAIVGEAGAVTVDKLTAPTKITLYPRGEVGTVLDYVVPRNNLVCELSDFVSLCRNGGENPYLSYSHVLYETLERVYEALGLTVLI